MVDTQKRMGYFFFSFLVKSIMAEYLDALTGLNAHGSRLLNPGTLPTKSFDTMRLTSMKWRLQVRDWKMLKKGG